MSDAVGAFMRSAAVVPVVVIENVRHAVPLANALLAGGVNVIEITLRSAAALACIEAIARDVPDIQLAVGTVLNPTQLRAARDAGARLAISPGIDSALINAAVELDIPLLPGICTASELMLGLNAGLSHFKLFPASAVNALELAKAYAGPFAQARFCPTGGISIEAAPAYLAQSNILCIGASWLASASAIRAEHWDEISKIARQSTQLRG